MIIDFFINLLKSIVNLLPSVPTGLAKDFSSLTYIFNLINYYLPVSELFICMGLYIILINWKVGFSILKWIGERIVV